MNIVVLIKQVPETSNVKMDPVTGTIIRDGVESIRRLTVPLSVLQHFLFGRYSCGLPRRI